MGSGDHLTEDPFKLAFKIVSPYFPRVIYARQTTHLEVYCHPDELRKIARSLDDAIAREEATIKARILPSESHSIENTIYAEGYILTFRPPLRENDHL
jgi:hypothetical protein